MTLTKEEKDEVWTMKEEGEKILDDVDEFEDMSFLDIVDILAPRMSAGEYTTYECKCILLVCGYRQYQKGKGSGDIFKQILKNT